MTGSSLKCYLPVTMIRFEYWLACEQRNPDTLCFLSIRLQYQRNNQLHLVRPSKLYISGYINALKKGWSPNNVRGAEVARTQLLEIEADPDRFLGLQEDLEAKGPPITLPDGSLVKRLPGFHRWIWDGEFCGSIGFRWQPHTPELPSYVLGHIGYAVVPWKRNQGYAGSALRSLLPELRTLGLPYIELTVAPGNIASRRVIKRCGGELIESFKKPSAYGGGPAFRYRIDLDVK